MEKSYKVPHGYSNNTVKELGWCDFFPVHSAILSLVLCCVVWAKVEQPSQQSTLTFLELPAPKYFFSNSLRVWHKLRMANTIDEVMDRQAVKSWDCYLKISHRVPEMRLGCFRRFSHEISRSAYRVRLPLLWFQLHQEFCKIISHVWQSISKRARKYMTCY